MNRKWTCLTSECELGLGGDFWTRPVPPGLPLGEAFYVAWLLQPVMWDGGRCFSCLRRRTANSSRLGTRLAFDAAALGLPCCL